MRQALLDTDTISFYFRNVENVVQKLDSHLLEFGFIKISVVTYYEILNGLYYKDARKQLEKFERFVELNEIVSLDQSSVKIAAEIFSDVRKKGLQSGTTT